MVVELFVSQGVASLVELAPLASFCAFRGPEMIESFCKQRCFPDCRRMRPAAAFCSRRVVVCEMQGFCCPLQAIRNVISHRGAPASGG
jgi:hypothetical protein